MDIKQLKNYLFENQDKIHYILEECGFHHIKKHSGSGDDYFTFANIDGDNQNAVTLYLGEHLLVVNYTRDICPNKNNCDIIDLVMFARGGNLFDNLKWISETAGISYYQNFKSDIPESLRIIKKLKEMLNKIPHEEEDNTPITPKDEKILSYYYPYVNDLFYEDGISYGTQREFNIGIDPFTGYIAIPIRDEVGTFVGVKGRYFDREVPEGLEKYYYLERFPKGKILYGYFRSRDYISESDCIYIVESEKGFLQMWDMNHRNCVATGGTKISQHQIDKLSRLNKRLIFSFDKDFTEEKIQNLRNKFLAQIDFWAIIDRNNILGEKESPHDNKEKFEYLINNNVYKIDRIEKENDK